MTSSLKSPASTAIAIFELKSREIKKVIRSFNYTGRQRIHHANVAVAITSEIPAEFTAQIDLSSFDLPGSARVFVEAYRGSTAYMRFDFGTVANLAPPADRWLREIGDVSRVRFRVKVVESQGTSAKLLAAADRVPPAFPNRDDLAPRAILDPVFEDTGDLIWYLDFDYADEPVLKVSDRIPGIKSVVASDASFAGLVYPSVFREILTRILFEEDSDDDDDDEAAPWFEDWFVFVQSLGVDRLEVDPNEETKRGYVSQAVSRLAAKLDAVSKYSAALQGSSIR
jgi:hypothetical protein